MSKLYRIILFSLPISPIAMIVVLLIIKPELLQYPKTLAVVLIPLLLIAVCMFAMLFIYKRVIKRKLETRKTAIVAFGMLGATLWMMANIAWTISYNPRSSLELIQLILAPIALAFIGITLFNHARTDIDRRNFFVVSGVLVIFMGILGTVIRIIGLK